MSATDKSIVLACQCPKVTLLRIPILRTTCYRSQYYECLFLYAVTMLKDSRSHANIRTHHKVFMTTQYCVKIYRCMPVSMVCGTRKMWRHVCDHENLKRQMLWVLHAMRFSTPIDTSRPPASSALIQYHSLLWIEIIYLFIFLLFCDIDL